MCLGNGVQKAYCGTMYHEGKNIILCVRSFYAHKLHVISKVSIGLLSWKAPSTIRVGQEGTVQVVLCSTMAADIHSLHRQLLDWDDTSLNIVAKS
jgi:hypothetical protein